MNRNPVPTVDVIIEIGDAIVLVHRRHPPPGWALPGGFIDSGESAEAAAQREALEETGLELRDLRQFRVYSAPDRDPRQHTISTVFIARAEGTLRAGDDAADVRLVKADEIGETLAFDHSRIVADYLLWNKGARAGGDAVMLEERKTSIQGHLLKKGSAFGKYRDIFVGKRGWLAFAKYESITVLFSAFPGAAGFFLRKLFFRRLLKKVGRGVVFGRYVTIRHPHKIEIGDHTFIDDFAVLDAKGEGNRGISIGANCFIGRGSVLSCKEGDIRLGDYVSISNQCSLLSESQIVIGPCSYLAGHCYLVAGGNHKYDRLDVPIMFQDADNKGGIVLAGNNWLGAGVQVLDGTTIGSGTIVGAGSTVYKKLDPNVIAAGVPAIVTKRRAEKSG